MACQWEECGKVFDHLPTLIDHIHNGESINLAVRRDCNSAPRPHWCAQVELHMRMEDMSQERHSTNVSLRSHLPHTLAHRREAIHLSSTRCAWSIILIRGV